jgi:hypothetical protein
VTTARGTPVSSANFAASFFNFLRVVANSTIYLQHAVLPNGAAQRYGANAGGSAQTEPGRQCTGAAFTECKSACTRGASWISCLKAPAGQWRIPEKGHRAQLLGRCFTAVAYLKLGQQVGDVMTPVNVCCGCVLQLRQQLGLIRSAAATPRGSDRSVCEPIRQVSTTLAVRALVLTKPTEPRWRDDRHAENGDGAGERAGSVLQGDNRELRSPRPRLYHPRCTLARRLPP